MKYFVKTDEVGCIQMILKEPHPMVEDFFELELTEEKYQELMQNIGSYRVNIQGSPPIGRRASPTARATPFTGSRP